MQNSVCVLKCKISNSLSISARYSSKSKYSNPTLQSSLTCQRLAFPKVPNTSKPCGCKMFAIAPKLLFAQATANKRLKRYKKMLVEKICTIIHIKTRKLHAKITKWWILKYFFIIINIITKHFLVQNFLAKGVCIVPTRNQIQKHS